MSEDDKPNPIATSQRLARQELPKRFFKVAEVVAQDGGFGLTLDGKTAKTPGRRPLVVADRAVADGIAAEWSALGDRIDPARLPVTRIVNSAIDAVADQMDAVRADAVKYAGSDLVCYRAEEPQSLIDAQDAAWRPLVDWARDTLGVRLNLAAGIMHVQQSPETLAAVDRAVAGLDALKLAAFHTITTLTGSAVIALALFFGRISVDEAWTAAHIDEDWQASHWGQDESALNRRAARRSEMDAAALILGRR